MEAMEQERRAALAALVERAAAALASASALVIAAGAGMGVDSGLPDFRGDEGFWRAYPPFRALGLGFADLANPRWFASDPGLAWGFYGHRLALYRRTAPHAGFEVLRRWAARAGRAFVFTSNVDGQFQRAGFDEAHIVECHGSIHHVQCTRECGMPLHGAEGVSIDLDPVTLRARRPWPACPRCGGLLRPAILMFGDGAWDGSRTEAQEERLAAWLEDAKRARAARGAGVSRGADGRGWVIVECGAGTHVPTVRGFSEGLARAYEATLVRINVREPEVPPARRGAPEHVGLALGAREALAAIDAGLERLG